MSKQHYYYFTLATFCHGIPLPTVGREPIISYITRLVPEFVHDLRQPFESAGTRAGVLPAFFPIYYFYSVLRIVYIYPVSGPSSMTALTFFSSPRALLVLTPAHVGHGPMFLVF
jgi:hypothetical protein